jgi:hypothetical protein
MEISSLCLVFELHSGLRDFLLVFFEIANYLLKNVATANYPRLEVRTILKNSTQFKISFLFNQIPVSEDRKWPQKCARQRPLLGPRSRQ